MLLSVIHVSIFRIFHNDCLPYNHFSISVILQKYSSFPYISYIEECLQSLRDAGEYPHDKTIDQLVQLQQITEKIDRVSTSNGTEPIKPGSGSELLLASIKSDLQNFHKRLPRDFENTRKTPYMITLRGSAYNHSVPRHTLLFYQPQPVPAFFECI